MTYDRKMSIIFWLLVAVMVILVMAPAYGDEGHGHNHDTGDVTVDTTLTGGDVIGGDNTASNVASISGGSSYGFSYGMGDVDLNQCMGSTQWGTILGGKQKLVLNKWCAAESLDSKGMYEAAAKLRCSIKEVSKVLGGSCIDALTVHADAVTSVPMADESEPDDEDERIEVLYALFSDLEAQRNEDKAEAEKAAQRPIPQPQTIIQQQEFINESKRAKLAALRGEK